MPESIENLEYVWQKLLINVRFQIIELCIMRIKSINMRLWGHKSLNLIDKVASTEVVNKIEHYQWNSKFEIDTVTEIIFFQKSLHIL